MQIELTQEEVDVLEKIQLYYRDVVGMSLGKREAISKMFFVTGQEISFLIKQDVAVKKSNNL